MYGLTRNGFTKKDIENDNVLNACKRARLLSYENIHQFYLNYKIDENMEEVILKEMGISKPNGR